MTKFLLLFIWLVFAFVCVISSAEASTCRHTAKHEVCILEIKRSAKNYWEYRAAVKIDDKERPIEVYNCRERVRIRQDGETVRFETGGAGEVICSLFKR